MPNNSNWRYLLASVQGVSHVQSGTPCQDFCIAEFLNLADSEVLVLAASDGAGSASHSQVGSEIACREFLSQVQYFFDHTGSEITIDHAKEWAKNIAARISLQAQTMELATRDFACTFLGAILFEQKAVFIQIGDGAIVRSLNGKYEAVFWPQSGEYVNTTSFITDAVSREGLNFLVDESDFDEIAIFSDGLQMLALNYASKSAHAPFFNGVFPPLRSQESGEAIQLKEKIVGYLSSNAINTRTDDDKTLVLATRATA